MPAKVCAKLMSSLAVVISIFVLTVPAAAQDAAAFYKDKTLKFIVSTGPGGGFDSYARMLAPLIAKELDATVVVQNMPGGGGIVATNSVYSQSGDALLFMILNGNAAGLAQLIGDPSVRFDVTKFGILGLITSSPWMWLGSPLSPLKTAEDFLKPGAKSSWGGSGQMGGISDGAAVTCEALQMNCKVVRGYNGSAQAALALARGEVDAMYVSDTSAASYVKSGGAKPILAVSDERSPFFPDVPTVFEALKLTPEQKWWFEFRSAIDDIQRMMAMPPNVPADRLAHMRKVVAKVLTDPAVIAEGEKTGRPIKFRNPAAVEKMINTVLVSGTPAQKEKAREVILRE
ncbi:MAG: extra-cytoplasmic solute receptor family protein [Rhodospirillales bacterium]|nr:extra-cytoplasmic solute receptor family protein [Rhodospirillales bacterium]